MRRFVMAAGMFAAMGVGPAFALGGDGPRAYFVVPTDTNILSLYAYGVDSDLTVDGTAVINGSLQSVLLAAQVSRAFDVGGRPLGLFGLVPWATIDGELDLPRRTASFDGDGVGDILLGGVFGVVGGGAMSREEYIAADPGFELGVLAKLILPTGDYDPAQAVNIGANRYSLQLGLPMGWYIGDSYLDPQLMTFEITPAVMMFTDNEDAFGRAEVTGQDPIYTVEAHFTRNINAGNWLSLDALYTYGGETSTDGVADGNTREALGLGATWNVAFSRETSLKISYGTNVYANDFGGEGQMVRLILSRIF
jgi:hypothetical protein